MKPCWAITVAVLPLALISGPAHACRMHAKLQLSDVSNADVVLVGRVSNYRIVRDVEFRRKMLASPKLPPDMRKFYEGPNGLISDYARFDVQVDRVLIGKVAARISVTWDNSTFGEPETMAAGPFLMALRRADSKMPPLRGPSATVLPSRDPGLLTVLQAPCSSPFLFTAGDENARIVESIVASRPRWAASAIGGLRT
jgi:hypothetical protein